MQIPSTNYNDIRAYLRLEWFYLTSFFVIKDFSKSLLTSESLKKSYQRMYLSKISIICTLWYESFNNLDAQSDFEKQFCHKKAGQVEPFLS